LIFLDLTRLFHPCHSRNILDVGHSAGGFSEKIGPSLRRCPSICYYGKEGGR
jgi:hypothetical protein